MLDSHSASVSATGQLVTGAGRLAGAILAAGVDAATAILYDNTAGSGTVLGKLAAPATDTSPPLTLSFPCKFSTGIYAVLTGTAPTITIYWL